MRVLKNTGLMVYKKIVIEEMYTVERKSGKVLVRGGGW